MKLILSNSKCHAEHTDNQEIENAYQGEQFQTVIIPEQINLGAAYKSAGYNVEMGFSGQPDPRTNNILSTEQLSIVNKATLAYQYQQKIKEPLVYNGWIIPMSNTFQNAMDKRVLMVEREQWIDTTDGFIDGAGEHHIITGAQVTEISLLMINHVRSCTTWYQQQLQGL